MLRWFLILEISQVFNVLMGSYKMHNQLWRINDEAAGIKHNNI